jgi:hypothetical protein
MFIRLYFDNELMNFLNITSASKISMVLLNGSGSMINEIGNFIIRDKNEIDTVLYTPKGKYDDNSEIYVLFDQQKGKVKIRIGRFIRKFISKQTISELGISDKDIEEFVNIFKSYFTPSKDNLTVVEGVDILKWYLEDNYTNTLGMRTGSLWNSCMRQRERNKFMYLYAKNPDKVKMLIFLTEDGKLRSRALLWQDVMDNNGISYKVMDRVYSIYDHDVFLFKSWAKENGYISKLEQSARCENLFEINGIPVYINCFIKLPIHDMRYYPYLDTFKYYNPQNGQFSNSTDFKYTYKLTQSSGGLDMHIREDNFIDFELYDEDDL